MATAVSPDLPLSKAPPRRPGDAQAAIALVVLTLLAYLPVLRAGFIWDDDFYVEHNVALRSLSGLWRIWTNVHATPQYYPLVHTSFWIEYHLWGAGWALGYHLDNLLIHAASGVLLWRLLRRLDLPAAWPAAALWAVHPLNVESVAWITERKNVLSGLFYLLAFGRYLSAIGCDGQWRVCDGQVVRSRSYAAAAVLFLLALLSKTVTATLPAAVAVVLWWKTGRLRWRAVMPLLPLLVLGAGFGWLTGYLERTQVGANGPDWNWITPTDRILIAGRAVCFYAGKLAVPWHLSFIYPHWQIDPRQLWQYGSPLLVAAVVGGLWLMRSRIGRGPLSAVLLFIGTLFPALGFANVYPMRYSFVADHFQYLAGAALLALAAQAAWRLRPPALRTVLLAMWIATLATLTFARCFVYRDRLTLWTATVASNPNSWMAHTNLGHALHAANRDAEATRQYQLALALAPNEPETHLNVAIGDAIVGRYADAANQCRTAIALDPTFAPAYANLAKALLSENDAVAAEHAARQAVAVAPTYAQGHAILAAALQAQGQLSQAAEQYQAALTLNPDDADSHFHLADCLAQLGHVRSAIAEYETSLALNPQNAPAWTTLGYSLLALHQPQNAATCFRRALQIEPTLQPAQQGLQCASVGGT